MRLISGNKIIRPLGIAVMTGLLTFLMLTACSEPTRYRVLSFFLDGVPEPGSQPAEQDQAVSEVETKQVAAASPQPIRRYFAHAPYRDNQCARCHSAETGQLVQTVSDGLCLNCHSDLVKQLRFVHGPVAVNDCTVCHHHHTAQRPKLLLQEPVATCLNCHDADDLADGDYHSDVAVKNCADCHNPHGGDDRFFLKPHRGGS